MTALRSRERVVEEVRRAIVPACLRHPIIERVYLFGSIARGDFHEESDVDLWVLLDRTRDHGPFAGVLAVDDIEAQIPRRCDILTDPEPSRIGGFRANLERDKVMLYERTRDTSR